MSDFDRDRESLRDSDPVAPPRDVERTTVIHTDGDRGRGSGILIAVILLVAVVGLLFYLFGGNLDRAGDEIGVNVNVDAPEMPDIPEVELKIPEKIEIDTDGNSSN